MPLIDRLYFGGDLRLTGPELKGIVACAGLVPEWLTSHFDARTGFVPADFEEFVRQYS